MYPLFESIQVRNGELMNLHWHQERVNNSYFRFFNQPGTPILEKLIAVPKEFQSGIVKCRFVYGPEKHAKEFSHYSAAKINTLQLVKDDTVDYSLKYSDRSSLERLREKRGACDEILIVKDGFITDTSFTNIVFFDGEKWVTPSRPLLKGTCRSRLLSEGKIVEAEITPNNLNRFTLFKLINAMVGFEGMTLPISVIKTL